jgi:hypothetical protein
MCVTCARARTSCHMARLCWWLADSPSRGVTALLLAPPTSHLHRVELAQAGRCCGRCTARSTHRCTPACEPTQAHASRIGRGTSLGPGGIGSAYQLQVARTGTPAQSMRQGAASHQQEPRGTPPTYTPVMDPAIWHVLLCGRQPCRAMPGAALPSTAMRLACPHTATRLPETGGHGSLSPIPITPWFRQAAAGVSPTPLVHTQHCINTHIHT